MRRVLTFIMAAVGLAFTACPVGSSGTQGAPAAPAVMPSTGASPSGGSIIGASHADGSTASAGESPAADTPTGPHAPMGDGEGITCGQPEPPRLRYGSDLSKTVDKTTDPIPVFDLSVNNPWTLKFIFEMMTPGCYTEARWVSHHSPGMKIRFILNPDTPGARFECDVPLDPPTSDPRFMVAGNDFYQFSVSAMAGKLSMYYDFDDDWKMINGGWVNQGALNCKETNAFVSITDDQYRAAMTFSTFLGSFQLNIPATSPDSSSTQTRTSFPILQ